MKTQERQRSNYITCRKCGQEKARYEPRRNICRDCRLEQVRESAARRYAECPEKYRGCPEKERQRQKEWRAKNPEKVKAKRHAYRKNNPHARRVDSIRARVCDAIRVGGGAKAHSTAHYLGYPVNKLVEWIEAQGGIPAGYHLDHITSFAEMRRRYPGDFVRQMREAWKFCNLRIIPAAQNLRKGTKREVLI